QPVEQRVDRDPLAGGWNIGPLVGCVEARPQEPARLLELVGARRLAVLLPVDRVLNPPGGQVGAVATSTAEDATATRRGGLALGHVPFPPRPGRSLGVYEARARPRKPQRPGWRAR